MLVSCGSTKISVQPLPVINKAPPPAAPQNQNMGLVLNYAKDQTKILQDLEDNAITKGNFLVPADSRVVISVPVEQQNVYRGNSSNTFDAKGSDAGDNVFKTAEYFNKAEQEIEKSLLRKGFTVIDRSKFEAELRERRTDERSQFQSDTMKAAIKDLEDKRDAKRITREEYLERLEDLESRKQIFEKGGSRSAGDKELVDIGELIRAAEKGTVQADFILQVNRFEIGPISDKNVYLPSHPELRTVINQDIGLLQALEKQGFANIIQPGYFGYLNAKLIRVKDGSIVWVGEHRVESVNVEDIVVQLDIQKVPANLDEVSSVSARFNRNLRDISNRARQEARTINNQDLEDEVRNSAKARYDGYVQQLQQLEQTNLEYPNWKYKYQIAQPLVSPRFPSLRDLQILKQKSSDRAAHNEFLRLKNYAIEHQSTLVKGVSKMLIGTIPASQ